MSKNQKKKQPMDIRITCSNLTAGMFQTGVFEAFHNVARVSNMFEAPDLSDQSDLFFFGAADQTGF